MLLGHLLPQIGKCEITLNNFLLLLHCVCHVPFVIWNVSLKRRDFLEVIAINGNIISRLNCGGYRI